MRTRRGLTACKAGEKADAPLLRSQEAFTVLNIPKVAVAALSLDKTLLAGLEIEPGALTAGAYEGVLLLLVARFIYRVRVRLFPCSTDVVRRMSA